MLTHVPDQEEANVAGWPTDKAVKAAKRRLLAIQDWSDPATVAATTLDAAGLPELVSHAEARAILGTRNPRLPAGMPPPLYGEGGVHPQVGDRSLWLRDDIEAFAKEFQARPHVRSRRAP